MRVFDLYQGFDTDKSLLLSIWALYHILRHIKRHYSLPLQCLFTKNWENIYNGVAFMEKAIKIIITQMYQYAKLDDFYY